MYWREKMILSATLFAIWTSNKTCFVVDWDGCFQTLTDSRWIIARPPPRSRGQHHWNIICENLKYLFITNTYFLFIWYTEKWFLHHLQKKVLLWTRILCCLMLLSQDRWYLKAETLHPNYHALLLPTPGENTQVCKSYISRESFW